MKSEWVYRLIPSIHSKTYYVERSKEYLVKGGATYLYSEKLYTYCSLHGSEYFHEFFASSPKRIGWSVSRLQSVEEAGTLIEKAVARHREKVRREEEQKAWTNQPVQIIKIKGVT